MTPEQEDDFRQYVAGQSRRLYRFAYYCCGDWHRAEDAVQNALIRLYGVWTRPGRTSTDAYVRKIIANLLIDESRLFRFRKERPTDVFEDRLLETAGPEDRLVLTAALMRLPARQRAAVYLRHCEDLTSDEVARVLGCSHGAARNLVMRGLDALRAILTDATVDRLKGAIL
ncbi:RNA polymerase sigma24 factor [Actinorhabdospora filicis]|uniref:RNA polymerase sigma24 factor n=1 Tax=Actinorhabdospora filicis TaxID=1785913 RepID=A0A9W6SVS6_9ACTN|nr:SigE family RNA polymerase sigma factor [Actinorhabdospora filicis]GLZ81656.1 RNA polymerase sigma24 factor [Actinorhabdospora filicis]